MQISSLFFKSGFYGLLAGNKAGTEVLLLAITRALLIHRLISGPSCISYRLSIAVSYLQPIKHRLWGITLNCSFFRASLCALAFYLLSMTCVCNNLSLEED